jgi:hypothetical protein
MFNWIKSLFRKTEQPTVAEPTEEPPEGHPVKGSVYDLNNIGEVLWDPAHNSDRLTVTGGGLTIEWDGSKDKEGEMTPSWIPASTRLFLHSGKFSLDFKIDEMGERQIGVGFMIQLTDGVNVGSDWGFFGYLGSSSTAWSYDPSTGDVVTATESIEGGLPKFENGRSGVVQMHVSLPRQEAGLAKFIVNGVESKPIPLPEGAVVLPAACFLKTGQRITLMNFNHLATDETAQQGAAADADKPHR